MESRNAIKKRVFIVLFAFGAYGAVLFVVYSLRFGVNLDLLMADPGAFLGQEYVSDPLKEYYFNFLMFFAVLSMPHFALFSVSVYCFVFPSLYLFFSIFCTLVYFCDYLPGCAWWYFRASVLLAWGGVFDDCLWDIRPSETPYILIWDGFVVLSLLGFWALVLTRWRGVLRPKAR